MYQHYPKFFTQSAIALGLTAALAGCGQNGDAQAQQPAPAGTEQQAAAQPVAPAVAPVAQAASETDPVVATLGAVSVSQDELQRFLQALPAPQRDAMRKDRVVLEQWLRTRLAEKAVVDQAKAQDWDDKPEIRQTIEEAQNQVILHSYLQSVAEPAADFPSEQELQAAYEANQAQFQVPAMYRISQIFLAAPQDDAQALARAKKEADGLVKQLREGKAAFAELAKAHSDEQVSAQRGGDNGYLPLAQLVPAMRTVVTKMTAGQISDPIMQPAGVHILHLTDRREASVRPIDEVKPALRDALRRQRQQEAAQAYVAGMLNAGTVSIDGKVLSAAVE
ncbi:peptidylprolyl isomerase [Alcaligenes faecalis]|uniref:peptidylprolyl isomerase n=1 Tax=Alcaligenes faecalis TaxID=511 RepID=UPI001EEF8D89|nr:peptidyl-prolyl cis-trans isomerase [Alcaligenes faecalis]ULH06470.1 peptidyl-prolyl cis-trans isomerase [Alcaligenes faecalis]